MEFVKQMSFVIAIWSIVAWILFHNTEYSSYNIFIAAVAFTAAWYGAGYAFEIEDRIKPLERLARPKLRDIEEYKPSTTKPSSNN